MSAAKSNVHIDYKREALVFRLADGLPVHTHFSFGFAALLVGPLFFQSRPASTGLVVALLMIPVLYLAVLAHELGHVYAARAQRVRTNCIEIGFLGGHAELEWDEGRPIAMRRIALAGPMVNLVLAGIFFALYWFAPDAGSPPGADYASFKAPGIFARITYLAAVLNFGLAVFNLLPAFPLDGGTIAQETLGARFGHRRATLAIGICGLLVTIVAGMVAFALWLSGIPVFGPLTLTPNWHAIRDNWRNPATAPETDFAKPSNVVTFRPYSRKPEET